jgi:hypothetical protein
LAGSGAAMLWVCWLRVCVDVAAVMVRKRLQF